LEKREPVCARFVPDAAAAGLREHSGICLVEVAAMKIARAGKQEVTMAQEKNSDRAGQRGGSNNENERRGSGGKESSGNKSGSSSSSKSGKSGSK
jgi:hypothetical protein